MLWAEPCAGDSGAQLHKATLPAIEELPRRNRDSHITKLLHHKTCDKCQNPNMLGHAQRGSVELLGQIREDFPEEETFELRWVGDQLFQAEGINLCKRTGEHLVGSSLKWG